ncbi:BZ3500_MvSof-1268-A1-R1_Chr1-3g02061 [Microbotryum saponariae]|uniref:Cleavage and polyadenylation specificity factor subunit 5 n=1 Tax=Microbotryum saponariae TaxID=289078 RepID=A0A2X0L4G5_9BASI|nr:BZ3500_MvSof-1268-A1-R1_Chr1-3g02061 [Microbotryum saponariae]SCZ95291.1 BZ3501_MvSof-1269-A2-R1_Chr1-3g01663 [Microbotryum saponariae]
MSDPLVLTLAALRDGGWTERYVGVACWVYPLDYVFNTKDPQYEEDPQNDFEQYGIRQTVEGVLLVHEHGHPHVLLLQVANAYFKLPGDYLKPNEPNKDGLGLRLDMRLGPKARDDAQSDPSMEKKQVTGWEVHDLLAQWWRPNYEQFMLTPVLMVFRLLDRSTLTFLRKSSHLNTRIHLSCPDPLYPSSHIAQPKEVKSMYLVQLPEHKVFTVPSNMKLIAIPLLELYDNAVRYGPLLAAVPHLLSKYRFEIG